MGKSSHMPVDHDGSDRITARVGSRTKKAKVVFDPSDHHVPRKRNRRSENDLTAVISPKSEPNQTATPTSSSSPDGGSNNVSTSSGGQQGLTQIPLFRYCMICGRNGPGRMPRKSTIAPWTCPGCLAAREADRMSKSGNNQEGQSNTQLATSNRVVEEDDTKQQHDFAGFSETELSGPENDNGSSAIGSSSISIKVEPDADSDDGHSESGNQISFQHETTNHSFKREAKEIRYWSCEDVCSYFRRHCHDWGDLFHHQEIDGASLMLMRKGDVLSRFGLKLGPAMELYQRIVALQNGDHDIVDVRLTWI